MTKLLYITNGINGSGGLERVLSIKASMLAEQFDYQVHIVCLNNAHKNLFYQFSPKIILHSIDVGGNPIQYLFQYTTGLTNLVTKIKPEIILVCDDGFKAFLLPILLKKTCPMVYERHVSKNISIHKNDSVFKQIATKLQFLAMDFLAKKYDRFVVLTNQNKTEWNNSNIVVMPNPLSFFPDKISNLQTKKVIAVGKQSYQKGYDLLLPAWQKVVQNHSDWKLEIYGKFDDSHKLNEFAIELDIEKNVSFFEPVQNIEEKYLESSIYVMSSRFEGFGMVLIEAMACGVPCVSFDCPFGPSDIIQNEVDGYIVENGNIDALANKLIQLIDDENLRISMGKNARENVKRFDAKNVVNQWHEMFSQLRK